MTQTEFDALVARLEKTARSDPKGYRMRVFLLAILGYAYIALIVGLVIGAVIGLIWLVARTHSGGVLLLKLIIPLGSLVVIAGRAMWVRLDPPVGRQLARSEAPLLFEDAERIARALKAPVPDVILVTSELNASVSQVPRLGIFGWRKNYLVIGLQLISALHPDYFVAVLAHEFAHLSRAHGHFSGWIYRLRRTWSQLVEMLERDQHIGTVIFSRFFNWYAPYFSAYSFVLARAYEYEADQLAATVAGHRDMTGALIVLAVKHRELDEQYWSGLWREAAKQPTAPTTAISDSLACVAARPDAERYGFWAFASLQERTGTTDTHPSLNERASALLAAEPVVPDEEPWIRILRLAFDRPTPPEDPPVRAAPRYLGALTATLAAEMDSDWRKAADAPWRERHAYCQRSAQQLEELDRRADTGPLPLDDAWMRSVLTEEFRSSEAAEPLYRELLERAPNHVGARFALGSIMLHRCDAEGVGEVERAMSMDASLLAPGAQLVTSYLTLTGRQDEAATYRARMLDRQQEIAEANQERNFIGPRTEFEASTLPPEVVAGLVAQLATHEDVTQAWLVRQVVSRMVDRPAHVLALTIDDSRLSDKAQEVRGNSIVETLSLPEGVNAFVLVATHAPIRKKVSRAAGSPVYVRERQRVGTKR
jgi:Zn-dependent protease with chaperone function